MSHLDDQIIDLGHQNAKGCYPIFEEDELNKQLPYFKLNTNNTITPFNYQSHNASIRMQGVSSYLSTNILPNLESKPLKGYFNIEIYDIHSHPNNNTCKETNFNNVFCFAKRKEDPINPHVPLLPDYYFMNNWDMRYNFINDNEPWKDKHSKIIFVGSTTGNSDHHKNERIQACLWSLENNIRHICNFFIVGFIRMNDRDVFKQLPHLRLCTLARPIRPRQQMLYRYLLNIDGDTCRWNPDVYFMNTLHFQAPSKDILWYSPLLRDGEHYVDVSFDQHAPNYILKMFQYYESNPNEAQRIIENARAIGKELFTPSKGNLYTINLFNKILENSAP
jgi:hypothetical protein